MSEQITDADREKAERMASDLAHKLPPDVLEHPMPFPVRLELAAANIIRVLNLPSLLAKERRFDDAEQSVDGLTNLLANIGDTLRSRGFVGPKHIDERVIAMAQANDQLHAQLDACEKERDEARQCSENWKSGHDVHRGLRHEAERENDRLRKERTALLEQHKEAYWRHFGMPKVICICGSSRFVDVSAVKAWEFNKQGIATFFMPMLPIWYPGVKEHHQAEAEGVARNLDDLWLKLIEFADEVFVVNVDGYIGKRTAIEIKHAQSLGKPVNYLTALKAVMPEGEV